MLGDLEVSYSWNFICFIHIPLVSLNPKIYGLFQSSLNDSKVINEQERVTKCLNPNFQGFLMFLKFLWTKEKTKTVQQGL